MLLLANSSQTANLKWIANGHGQVASPLAHMHVCSRPDSKECFHALNRRAALHNISIHYPAMSINHTPEYLWWNIRYLCAGGEALASGEGTTKGGPLAMHVYAVGIMPLLHELQPTGTKQVWFTDDTTGGRMLKDV